MRGVGGTRHCDWWFSDEAVILDTSGHSLPVEADNAQWLSFLDLLGKYRPKKPINGLVVGVSIKDLLSGGEENVEKHAARIRARIDELIERLGISFPIYVVFTKCDLVRGFVEFFGNLSRAERAEVWGTTFGRDRIARSSAVDMFDEEIGGPFPFPAGDPLRLAEESNMDSRPEILFFPLQFDAIRRRLTLFIDTLLKENPYQEKPIFRGVYFTSGTQEGRPLDQVINAMLAGFGIGEKEEGMYVEPTQTKSYFIENVFSKIIFPRSTRRRALGGKGAQATICMRVKVFVVGAVGLFLLFFALLGLSSLNRSLLNDTRELGSKAGAVASDDRLQLSLDDVKTIDGLRGKLDQIERKSSFGAKALLLGTSSRIGPCPMPGSCT